MEGDSLPPDVQMAGLGLPFSFLIGAALIF